MAAGIVVLCLGIAAIFLRLNSVPATAPVPETVATAPSLSLTLTGNGPNLLVSWTGGTSSPKQAHLKIYDGDSVNQIDLAKNFSPSGSITVPRHSGNVQAVISVNDGVRNWESQSSLIDQAFASSRGSQPNAASASAPKTTSEQSDIEKLKAQNVALQSRIKALRQQIEYAPYRKRR